MHKHDSHNISIKHIPIGGNYSFLNIERYQLKYPKCKFKKMQNIPFLYTNHFITITVKTYTEGLLSTGIFTNKEVAYLTGINRNLVKEINKDRLIKKYTIDGKGEELIKLEVQATYLGIDEFKLYSEICYTYY